MVVGFSMLLSFKCHNRKLFPGYCGFTSNQPQLLRNDRSGKQLGRYIFIICSSNLQLQVVCSRGEMFTGTWFSTFSGYITRMRGYLG